jgi:Protein of unknown function (DUF1579)
MTVDDNAGRVMARRTSLALAVVLAATTAAGLSAQVARDTSARSAAERMQVPGPEGEQLKRRVGTWDVVSTLRLAPDTEPIVTSGLIAERTMVGGYLQEVMRPAPGTNTPDFRRIAYLYFDRVVGRWQYVSLDTRFPVGIMPARSFEPEAGRTLTLEFDDLAFVGLGREVEGRVVQSNLVITRESDDREIVKQYWTRGDGTGRRWLAVQYEYTRRQ